MREEMFDDSETHYAYSCIHRFFDVFQVSQAIGYIHSIIYAACKPKVWNKEIPANVLYFIDKLDEICKVMYVLHNNAAVRTSATIELPEHESRDINIIKLFQCNNCRSNFRNNVPRNLTVKQFYNPYNAIDKFCKHMHQYKWQRFFKDIVHYALSNEVITYAHQIHKVLKAQKRLLQLIEACYLIEVRANVKE